METFHPNSLTPKKSSKKRKLNERKKAYNKRLAGKRAVIERVNAKIKAFKITAYSYRNHCRRQSLRMSLICGAINFNQVFNVCMGASLIYFPSYLLNPLNVFIQQFSYRMSIIFICPFMQSNKEFIKFI
ncbi:MAG: hypothetical protein LBG43_00010 [Treponema sp.]|nr:hypothetical protein [Treponema sp.]